MSASAASDFPAAPASGLLSGEGALPSEELDAGDIPETDIVFECPNCSKSLSIDPRGAGLVIRCTQCGEAVTVPIPEGMEIEDFDATPEELSSQLLQTRQALSKAQKRVSELEEKLADARVELEEFRLRADRRERSSSPFRAAIARSVKEAEQALASLREVAALSADALNADEEKAPSA